MNNIKFTSPFAVYIHVPFCISKCNYCDFYSRVYSQQKKESYIEALKEEIKIYAGRLNYRKIKTLYFGGGTPGLLTPDEAAEIINYIEKYFSLAEQIEITVEANPSSLTEDKIKGYYQAGINRLSLGIQSFNNRELTLLGRRHSQKEAVQAIKKVSRVFANYNIDLIFAIPGQNCKQWLQTLTNAVKMNPHHISTYNLEIHEDTPLGKEIENGNLNKVSEEIDAEMYMQGRKFLQKEGYNQYEISSFALPGYQAEHNKVYWQFEPYLGLGPAAHGFDGNHRFYNYSDVDRYIKDLKMGNLCRQDFTVLSKKDLMAEMMIMGLRLINGVSKKKFRNKFGIGINEVYGKEVNCLIEQKLIIDNGDNIFLTKKGLLLGNQVFMKFLKS